MIEGISDAGGTGSGDVTILVSRLPGEAVNREEREAIVRAVRGVIGESKPRVIRALTVPVNAAWFLEGAPDRDEAMDRLLDDGAAKDAHLLKVIAQRDAEIQANRPKGSKPKGKDALIAELQDQRSAHEVQIARLKVDLDDKETALFAMCQTAKEHQRRIRVLEDALRAAKITEPDHGSNGACNQHAGLGKPTGGPCNCGMDEHNAAIEKALRGEA